MKRLPLFFSWLVVASLGDWLIMRTLARAAIFMPKPSIVLQIYQAINLSGLVASNLTSLLAFLVVGWIAWRQLQSRRSIPLTVIFIGLILSSLLALFISSGGWLELAFQTLLGAGYLHLMGQGWQSPLRGSAKVAIVCSGLALLASRLYQALPMAYTILQRPGPPSSGEFFFNAGELMILLSIFALWWCHGRQGPRWIWLVACLPVLFFGLPRLINPAMTGILAIWSIGLTLYLPWPLYAAAIWLAGVVVINALRLDNPAGWAILLFAAGGYAPQLNIHAFLGLIALWLLVNSPGSNPQPILAETVHSSNSRAPVILLDQETVH